MQTTFPPRAVVVGALCALISASDIRAEDSPVADIRSLPEAMKRREQERLVAQSKRRVEKLKSDLKEIDIEGSSLQTAMTKASEADEQTADLMKQFMIEKTRSEQFVELYALQIAATKSKADALKALRDAQQKSFESLLKRAEFMRQCLDTEGLEAKALDQGPLPSDADVKAKEEFAKKQTELTQARGVVSKLEAELAIVTQAAVELTKVADGKMGLADEAAVKAKRRAQLLGLDGESKMPDSKAGPKTTTQP